MALEVASLYGRVKVDINDGQRKLSRFRSDFHDTGSQIKRTGGFITNNLKTAVIGAVGAFGALELGRIAMDMGKLGSQAKKTGDAFRAFSGGPQQAAINLKAMERAAPNLLSTMEKQSAASRFLSMGLAENSDQLEQLTRIAVTTGATMNKGPNQALEEFGLLLSNRSIPRLDTFGISAARVRARMKELEAAGHSTDEAFRFAVIEQGTKKVELLEKAGFKAADAGAILGSEWRKLKEEIATASAGIAHDASIGLAFLVKKTREGISATREFRKERAALNKARDIAKQGLLADQELGLDEVGNKLARFNALVDEGKIEEAVNVFSDYAEIQDDVQDALAGSYDIQKSTNTITEEAITGLLNARGAVDDYRIGLEDATDSVAGFANAQQRISSMLGIESRVVLKRDKPLTDLERKLVEQRSSEVGGSDALMRAKTKADQEKKIREDLAMEEKRLAEDVADSRTRTHSRAMSEMEQREKERINEVRSAVEGAIDLDISVGEHDFLLQKFGMRPDAVNEAGRRLEDIINQGVKSPWVNSFAELRGLTGDELKATAVKLQQDIDKFLRPDLLNQDAILRNARETLVGQQNREKMVNDLTAQLMKEGFAEGDVKKALGAQFGMVGKVATDSMKSQFDASQVDFVGQIASAEEQHLENERERVKGIGKAFIGAVQEGAVEGLDDFGIIEAATQAVLAELEEATQR